MNEVTLPSGAKLSITLPEFSVSRDLFQAIAEEAKSLKMDPKAEVDVNVWKDLFCTFLCSKKIESCLWKCMERATYNGLKIDKDTFEKEEARDDYLTVCYEVAKKSILPFSKSLFAKYAHILGTLKSSLA